MDAYLATVERMEPDIAMIDAGAAHASIAISLKRIADALDRVTTPDGLVTILTAMKPAIEALDH